jgi:hypothetical protein
MMKKVPSIVLILVIGIFFATPLHCQNLTEIYVSESGSVLGMILYCDPGFPSYVFVKGGGALIWVNMEIPGAIIEINSVGNVNLVERTSPGSITYADGRISRIGEIQFQYESGRVRTIGNLRFEYYRWDIGQTGKLTRIGDIPIMIEDGFLRQLGPIHFEYENGLIRKIDNLVFNYETGRIRRIGEVQFDYDYGTLKTITGNIPGVALKITSVIEFRRSLSK